LFFKKIADEKNLIFESKIPMKDLKVNISVILLSLFGFIISQYSAFVNPYIISEDIRTDYYMFRFHDPSLLSRDYFANFFSLFTKSLSFGYYIVYYIFTYFLEIAYAHTIVALILFLIASLYMFKIGCVIKDKKTGFLMVFFLIFYSWITADFSGGTRSVFGVTILIASLYYLMTKKTVGIAVSCIAMFLFYPPLLPIIFLSIFLLSFKTGNKVNYFNKREIILFFIIMLLISAALQYQYITKLLPVYGGTFSHEEIVKMPIVYQGGRGSELLPLPSLLNKLKGYIYEFNFMFALVIIFVIFLRHKLFALPKAIYIFLISGLFMYQLSALRAFELYRPSSYLANTIPIFIIILCAFGVASFLELKAIKKVKIPFLISFLCLSTVFHYGKLDSGLTNYKDTKLYQFVSGLPKDALIAGWPYLMDDIAFFGKRNIFTSKELIWAVTKKFYKEHEKRTYIFFTLFYSNSTQLIYNLCKENGIDYILVEEKYFQKDFLSNDNFYFNPFNNYIRKIVKNNKYFALNNIPERFKIFSEKGMFIIKIEDLLSCTKIE
jgi:hypothetical protein